MQRITEETALFFSVFKWVALATAVGLIVGLSTAVFLKLLQWTTALGVYHPYYFLLLPAAMFLSVLPVKYPAPDAEGHRTEKVLKALVYPGKFAERLPGWEALKGVLGGLSLTVLALVFSTQYLELGLDGIAARAFF